MIQELLTLTKNTPNNIFIDVQELPSGMFFLVDLEGNVKEIHQKDKEESIWEDKYKSKYFYSRIIDSNKAVLKGIATNNIYAFVTWQEKFVDIENINNFVESYYNKLIDLGNTEEKVLKTKNILLKVCKYIHEHVYDYFQKIDKKTGDIFYEMEKNRISIYIDVTNEEYEESSKLYLKDKLYLDKSYNLEINEEIFGVPSNNNSYNSKKKFLKHVTQSNAISYQCSFDDCYIIYKLYDWLKNIAIKYKTNSIKLNAISDILEIETNSAASKYYLIQGQINRSALGTEFVLNNFQFVSLSKDEIRISNDNFLECNIKSVPTINNWNQFEEFIKLELFYGIGKKEDEKTYLYTNDIPSRDDNSSNLIAHWIEYANSYKLAILYKDLSLLKKVWNKSISDFMFDYVNIAIKNSADKEGIFINKIIKLLLVKYNVLETELIIDGGQKMKNNLIETRNSIKEKIENFKETAVSLTVDEYCFAAGQLAKYLVCQSESKDVSFRLAEPILNCKTKEKMDTALKLMLKKYEHALNVKNRKLNNLIALTTCVTFEKGEEINKDMVLAGFVSSNIMFEKSNENKEEN
jgi:CRISPR-associated protein Csh1